MKTRTGLCWHTCLPAVLVPSSQVQRLCGNAQRLAALGLCNSLPLCQHSMTAGQIAPHLLYALDDLLEAHPQCCCRPAVQCVSRVHDRLKGGATGAGNQLQEGLHQTARGKPPQHLHNSTRAACKDALLSCCRQLDQLPVLNVDPDRCLGATMVALASAAASHRS